MIIDFSRYNLEQACIIASLSYANNEQIKREYYNSTEYDNLQKIEILEKLDNNFQELLYNIEIILSLPHSTLNQA